MVRATDTSLVAGVGENRTNRWSRWGRRRQQREGESHEEHSAHGHVVGGGDRDSLGRRGRRSGGPGVGLRRKPTEAGLSRGHRGDGREAVPTGLCDR